MTFPATRLRRTRSAPWSRALHAETTLSPANLIWPLFIAEGTGVEEPIAALPGVSRWSVDGIVARAKEVGHVCPSNKSKFTHYKEDINA